MTHSLTPLIAFSYSGRRNGSLLRREADTLEDADLLELGRLMCQAVVPLGASLADMDPATLRLNYDVYCTIRSETRPRLQRIMLATTFLKVRRAYAQAAGRVRTLAPWIFLLLAGTCCCC